MIIKDECNMLQNGHCQYCEWDKDKMCKCAVFYETWQMECCQTAFGTGDTVKWLVYSCEGLNTPVDVGKADYCYEAHDSNWENLFMLDGKEDSVQILYQKYVPSEENSRLLIAVSGVLVEVDIYQSLKKGDMTSVQYMRYKDEKYGNRDANGF